MVIEKITHRGLFTYVLHGCQNYFSDVEFSSSFGIGSGYLPDQGN